ncbi:MAG TPA: glycosyltransferase family 39 protein [Luteimonas sp.]|nr:glycosyltransferase family 39 protein [Luteimonas sp.]
MISTAPGALRRSVALALLVVLLLRLLHMHFAIVGPLTWQLGPDEDFYRRFGMDVAFGGGGLTDEFAFMDPLYGYIVGGVLKAAGGLFPLYPLQILVDCATAFGLYRIACELRSPRAGIVAILLYAVTGTAIAYTMSILKATWVACFIVYWMYAALVLLRRPGLRTYAAFGLWCGIGVALRANLLLLVPLGIAALAWLRWREGDGIAAIVRDAAALLVGLALPLALLAARNHAISGHFSPMPNNGGIVLHQLYNPNNPQSRAGVPHFVRRYSAPGEIWAEYRKEAERRAGHPLKAHEVNAYWKGEATQYLVSHPWQSLVNGVRKLREFSAYPEVPNTRNYGDERLVSPLLRALPLPFGWLFALGVPGLIWLLRRDRRAVLVFAPLLMGMFTIAVFFAEDRFRFNIVGPFVLGAAFWLEALWRMASERRWRMLALGLAISGLLGAWSIVQARLLIPPFPSDWSRLAWGYLKSGQTVKARGVLDKIAGNDPQAVGLEEFRGYLALTGKRYEEAVQHYENAVRQRTDRHEVWHNYSLALEETGRVEEALAAEAHAEQLSSAKAYRLRIADLLDRLDRHAEAQAIRRAERAD